MEKDEIKRRIAEILPEDTSSDLITRLATYIVENYERKLSPVKLQVTCTCDTI